MNQPTIRTLGRDRKNGTPEKKQIETTEITIPRSDIRVIQFNIVGIAPLVINAFPAKAIQSMREAQERTAVDRKKKKVHLAKDFELCYEQSKHISREGWCGIYAGAFRAGMVSACRLIPGLKMTLMKLSVSIDADGFDRDSGMPLVRITKGEPHKCELPVRLPNGVFDIHPRAMWDEGWEAELRIRYDAHQLSESDVANLLNRVGQQIGVGEGRPDSKNSCGMGWGLFEVQG